MVSPPPSQNNAPAAYPTSLGSLLNEKRSDGWPTHADHAHDRPERLHGPRRRPASLAASNLQVNARRVSGSETTVTIPGPPFVSACARPLKPDTLATGAAPNPQSRPRRSGGRGPDFRKQHPGLVFSRNCRAAMDPDNAHAHAPPDRAERLPRAVARPIVPLARTAKIAANAVSA